MESLLGSIRDADSHTLSGILREIRSRGEDAEYYAPLKRDSPEARSVSRTGYVDDATGSPLVELGKIMGTLQLEEGDVRYFGPTSNLSLISNDAPSTLPPKASMVPSDAELHDFFYAPELVEHLLSLYWSWQHQYFVLLDKDLFLRDLHNGGKFCSGTVSILWWLTR